MLSSVFSGRIQWVNNFPPVIGKDVDADVGIKLLELFYITDGKWKNKSGGDQLIFIFDIVPYFVRMISCRKHCR